MRMLAPVVLLLVSGCTQPNSPRPTPLRCKGFGCPHIAGDVYFAIRDSASGAVVPAPSFTVTPATQPAVTAAATCADPGSGACTEWLLVDYPSFHEAMKVSASAVGYQVGSREVEANDDLNQCCLDGRDLHLSIDLTPVPGDVNP